MPKPWYQQHDPDTGRFIDRARWEELREEAAEEFDDYADLNEWDELGEDEYLGEG
jgi:hypothetical protein